MDDLSKVPLPVLERWQSILRQPDKSGFDRLCDLACGFLDELIEHEKRQPHRQKKGKG